jgi:hypothetical protein
MITAVVRLPLPATLGLDEARDLFRQVAGDVRHPEGLVGRYFLMGEDGRTAGGVYLWRSRELAEGFYQAYAHKIAERFGQAPSVTYFH